MTKESQEQKQEIPEFTKELEETVVNFLYKAQVLLAYSRQYKRKYSAILDLESLVGLAACILAYYKSNIEHKIEYYDIHRALESVQKESPIVDALFNMLER